MTWAQICHCGHDRASHFEEKHTCLGMLCDCREYADREVPKPKVKSVISFSDDFTVEDEAIDTPRMACPPGCTCAACLFWFGKP